MDWNPKRRYSAVAVFDADLERVVLIHKLTPEWQKDRANFPGGKVEGQRLRASWNNRTARMRYAYAHRRCALRELREETGLDLFSTPDTLKLFCTLRFRSREGDDAECQFFCCVGDVDAAKTLEQEHVFTADALAVMDGVADYRLNEQRVEIDPLPELPWLCAMAIQVLRGNAKPATVYLES